MKLGIMQPYFFPYIGYWQLIYAVDTYLIYDDVNYIKGGWINRNRILMNGEANFINLHLSGASPNKLINEVGLLNDPIRTRKLLKTIEESYRKAPHFDEVFPLIARIINQQETNLAKYLEFQIKEICGYLDIDTEIIVSSSINKKSDLKFQDRVIDICKHFKAGEYINSIGGQSLYSKDAFAANGIRLQFLKGRNIEYRQYKNEFVPNLSVIDVMMFNSREEMQRMLGQYTLV